MLLVRNMLNICIYRLGPARPFTNHQRRGFNAFNPISLLPFKPGTVETLVRVLNLHVAGLTMNECAETAKFKSPSGLTCMFASCPFQIPIILIHSLAIYMENLCDREYWFRLFGVFDPATRTTTIILHNLLAKERAYIEERLADPLLQPFTLHPMFIPTLTIELLFGEALQLLNEGFIKAVRLYIVAKLIPDARYNDDDRMEQPLDPEQGSEESLKHAQLGPILLEKMESAVKIATTLLSWMPDFEIPQPSSDLESRFQTAGEIIQNRLQYLVDTLELQMIRVKRAQGHTELNRLGVSFFWHLFPLLFTGIPC